jgi:hypothetical protein
MATLKITPNAAKFPQLQAALRGRLSSYVPVWTHHSDGTVTLHGNMRGILVDVERILSRDGLLVQTVSA